MPRIAKLKDDYIMNFDDRCLYKGDKVECKLRKRPAEILEYLCSYPYCYKTLTQINNEVTCLGIAEESVKTYISNLRTSNEIFREIIENSSGLGYRYIGGEIYSDKKLIHVPSNLIFYKSGESEDKIKEIFSALEKVKDKKTKICLLYIIAPPDFDMLHAIDEIIGEINGENESAEDPYVFAFVSSAEFDRFYKETYYQELIDRCDYLAGFFYADIDIDPQKGRDRTIAKIEHWKRRRKPISLFVSMKSDTKKQLSTRVDQSDRINELRKRYSDERRRNEYMDYNEYYSDDIRASFYKSLCQAIGWGKFRASHDSDHIARISNPAQLREEIKGHTALVARNLLYRNFQESWPAEVWNEIAEKLSHEVVYLREALYILVDYEEYRHPIYMDLVTRLAGLNQNEFALFLQYLYEKNYNEFMKIDEMGLASDDNVNIRAFHKMIEEKGL